MANKTKELKFIDLFAGIGGIRKGFELACKAMGIKTKCVFTSEIKPFAIKVLQQNHPNEKITGDITKVDEKTIPRFDYLLGGFPCQAFSAAGKRQGFADTRGTLFFDVERIIKEHKPKGFILENVEGLVNHDRPKGSDSPIGNTLTIILGNLKALGYKVSWKVLNAKDFGVPQDRRRIYIVGTKKVAPNLEKFPIVKSKVEDILESGLECTKSKFVKLLLSHYTTSQLMGKSIKDKRGGKNNIHSWDIDYKGETTQEQKAFLSKLMTERRKHEWAKMWGIDWMDGMPLSLKMIKTFWDKPNLRKMLRDLVAKKYLRYEPPKKKVQIKTENGRIATIREPDPSLGYGYNIVAGKMSFEVSKVLDPKKIAPTLVAMDMRHLFVVDKEGIRPLSLREGLGLFGYPKDYKFDVSIDEGYDLLGNTVVVPVIKAVATRLLVANKERS